MRVHRHNRRGATLPKGVIVPDGEWFKFCQILRSPKGPQQRVFFVEETYVDD